jgi:hypothetical protein
LVLVLVAGVLELLVLALVERAETLHLEAILLLEEAPAVQTTLMVVLAGRPLFLLALELPL